jgi:hypothetical protein
MYQQLASACIAISIIKPPSAETNLDAMHCFENPASTYNSSTQLPLSSTSKTSQSTCTFSSPKILTISAAIASKLSVARARMVGPAPERHIPSRPGWVVGVREDRMVGRPGIWD